MIKYQDNTVPFELSLNKIDFNLQQNDLNNYKFQLQFNSGDLKYQNYPFLINKLNLSGAAEEKELHLNQFSLGISEIGFTGQGVVNFESSPYPVQGNFGVRGKLNQFSQFLQDFLQHKISIHERIFVSNFKFGGNVNEPRIEVEADLPDFEIDDVLVKNGKLNAVYQTNQLSLDRMHLNMMGGSVSGRGNVLLDSLLTHNFVLAVEGINLNNVLQFISKQESSHTGLLSGKIESKGSLQDFMKLQIRSQFELAKVKYLSKPIPDLNTNISFNQGSATFELVQGYSKIQANLSLRNEDIKGMFSVSIPKLDYLAGFFNLFEVGGIIDITGTIAGSLKKPAIAGKLAGSEIHYQNFPIDSIYGNISYENGIINFEDAGFTGTLSSIDSLAPIFHIPDVRGGFVYFESQDFHSRIDRYEISVLNVSETPTPAPFFVEASSPILA